MYHGPNHPDRGSGIVDAYHTLELISVSHTGPIVPPEKASCWSRVTGSITSGLILKDVTFEVHSGEVMAILGSKGKLINCLLTNCPSNQYNN